MTALKFLVFLSPSYSQLSLDFLHQNSSSALYARCLIQLCFEVSPSASLSLPSFHLHSIHHLLFDAFNFIPSICVFHLSSLKKLSFTNISISYFDWTSLSPRSHRVTLCIPSGFLELLSKNGIDGRDYWCWSTSFGKCSCHVWSCCCSRRPFNVVPPSIYEWLEEEFFQPSFTTW